MNTALNDFFFRRLKLISRLGSQLWLVNIKITNPRTGKYFIEQTVKPTITGLFKMFLCRYIYPVRKWKFLLLSCLLLSGGNRVLKDNCSMQRPHIVLVAKWRLFSFLLQISWELIFLKFVDCFPFPCPLENRLFDVRSSRQTSWKCLQQDTRRLGGARKVTCLLASVSHWKCCTFALRFCGFFTDLYAYVTSFYTFQGTAEKWAYVFFLLISW